MTAQGQREHYCTCGRWASFGFRPSKSAPMVWACGVVDGKPACVNTAAADSKAD